MNILRKFYVDHIYIDRINLILFVNYNIYIDIHFNNNFF